MGLSRTTLLHAYLAKVRARRLRPGEHDCALFAAGWVEACSGVDLAAEWRGQYSSLKQGQALLVENGIADHIELAARHLSEIAGWMQARPGDIAAVPEGDVVALGIVGGAFVHVLTLTGPGVVHLDRAERVFRP